MVRRVIPIGVLLVLMGLFVVGPVQAKCCALDHLVVMVPGQGAVRISAAELDDQFHPAEQGNLYWPLLNAPFKGDHRPDGDLGAGYGITYVLQGLEGGSVEVRETVFLDAEPPVAFARRGQTHELYPGDVRAVPWGWRPFPERAANALLFLIDEAGLGPEDQERAVSSQGAVVSLERDVVTASPAWWVDLLLPGAAILLTAVTVGLFYFRRQRSVM